MKKGNKYNGVTIDNILNIVPVGMEVIITIISDRNDFKLTNNKDIDEIFGYPYLKCIKIKEDGK